MTSSKLNSSLNLGSKTKVLLRTGVFCDVRVVLFDGTAYDLHRLLLAAASGYFRALLDFEARRTSNFRYVGAKYVVPIYRLESISKKSFEYFLGWAYEHKLELSPNNIENILIEVGGYLDCAEVAMSCVSFLIRQMSDENVIGMKRYQWTKAFFESHSTFKVILRFSKFYNVFDLCTAAHNYLTFRFGYVSSKEEFLELSPEELLELLSFNGLNAEESVVWEALLRWMNHKHRYLRRRNLDVLIQAVRIGQVHICGRCLNLSQLVRGRSLYSVRISSKAFGDVMCSGTISSMSPLVPGGGLGNYGLSDRPPHTTPASNFGAYGHEGDP
jgi:hypothetical protein